MHTVLRVTRAARAQRILRNGTVIAQSTRTVSKCQICSDDETLIIRNKLGLDATTYACACDEIGSKSQVSFAVLADRYFGIHAIIKTMLASKAQAGAVDLIKGYIPKWRRDGKTSIWLHVPITQSHMISEAVEDGFRFHHAEDDYSCLALWLSPGESRIPTAATHQVGVGGFCIDTKNGKVLLVKETRKNKDNPWKLPGGLSLQGEDIDKTAIREVFEETGIVTEFQSVIGFRQRHNYPGVFGKSDAYIVVKLKPITFNLTRCPREIEDCKWVHLSELLQSNNICSMTIDIVQSIFSHRRENNRVWYRSGPA